jgi:hypothetical protein
MILVTIGTVHLLRVPGPTLAPPLAASTVKPRATSQPPALRLTGNKRVTAHAGTVTVVTTLRVAGSGSVAVRVPGRATIQGLSQLRVERVTGPQMHPFSAVSLRSGTVLRLRGSYRWHGCPRHGPSVWPQPFALPATVRVHWHRIDVPRNGRAAVCH